MKKLSWLKDSLIQIMFISFAVVFTVFIAQISLTEQYTVYYNGKLEENAKNMARNAALLFSEHSDLGTAENMSYVLSAIFQTGGDNEKTSFTIYGADGKSIFSTARPYTELPPEALDGEYTYFESPYVRTYVPIETAAASYILMIQIDDTSFIDYSGLLSESMYASLFRGCFMMAAGYLLFSVIGNLRKKKKTDIALDDEEDDLPMPEDPVRKREKWLRVLVQLISMLVFVLLALPFLLLAESLWVVGVIFLSISAIHLLRILLWLIAWQSKKPISTYAAQTMQFFVFLVVFLVMYVISITGGYTTQIEAMTQDELINSSVFAGLSLSGSDRTYHDLLEQSLDMDFGINNEVLLIMPDDNNFVMVKNGLSIPEANDLFFSAWEGQTSVTGIRGDYKYGVTVVLDSDYSAYALIAIRQSSSVLADEMQDTTIDFLLAMSATVFAFVFLFVELNRLLEILNIPNLKREREFKYASGSRSLMFLANACRYVPLYFFVLIVRDIYHHNPVAWLPGDIATVLPIAVVLLVMAVGRDIAAKIIRLKARRMMIFGCFVGMIGFMALNLATTLPLLLLLLTVTYSGLSMVYNGIWDYANLSAYSGYKEYHDLNEQTLSGEYLGGTAGAVIGAMVFDKFGLFAAFTLSAVIMLILAVLIRTMLPIGNVAVKAEKLEYGFFRFFFSGRVLVFMFLLLMPFVFGEYFIEQFSPLYAAAINLSPGAASWTSLIMTMTIAYLAPSLLKLCGQMSKTAICIFANLIALAGLVLFILMPGLIAMYATSAIIGLSIGLGKNIFAARYLEINETHLYAGSGSVYNLFDSLFGLLGAALFTLAYMLFV
ncbi:MAG: MFS transporter [Lachnospiraceae bacterium]|nr:MFS transporter [Lachnospiraceae bacterium]